MGGWAIVMALLAACAAPSRGQEEGVRISLGQSGLSALRYGGGDVLYDGEPLVTGAFFRKWDGAVYAADVGAGKRSMSRAEQRCEWAYPWGRIGLRYRPEGSRLYLSVDISTERDADTLVALYLRIAEVRFRTVPTFRNRSFFFYGNTTMAHNIGGPGVVGAEYDGGTVVLCNEQMGRPLSFGFGDSTDGKAALRYPVLAYTGRHPMLKEKWPFIDRPVYPGGTDHFELSIRFGPAGSASGDLADDLYQRFAETYPLRLSWDDRRPIGRLFLSSSHKTLADNYATNPRGWFNDKEIDVTTEEGRAQFRERLMKWADRAVEVCTEMDAQGVIAWDPEGQEHPHMISYLGDARSLPPEMEPLADEFFGRFSEAGLRTGICIRPQRPVRTAYGDRVFQLKFTDRRELLANLSKKIEAARERWGCTLFYMDSNVHWYGDPVRIPEAEGHTAMVDDELMRQLTAKYPDILLVPEWETLRTYAYCAPYSQLNYNKLTEPPAHVLRTYAEALLVNAADLKTAEAQRDELVTAVKRGDILFFQGWYPARENAVIKSIYEEARK
jgi:hypothetical protein